MSVFSKTFPKSKASKIRSKKNEKNADTAEPSREKNGSRKISMADLRASAKQITNSLSGAGASRGVGAQSQSVG